MIVYDDGIKTLVIRATGEGGYGVFFLANQIGTDEPCEKCLVVKEFGVSGLKLGNLLT